MKPEEAIEDIRKCIQPSVGGKSLQMAIEALEKQVPKKPIICGENPDGTYQFKCPECGRLWWEKSYITKYCDGCGSATDRGADV